MYHCLVSRVAKQGEAFRFAMGEKSANDERVLYIGRTQGHESRFTLKSLSTTITCTLMNIHGADGGLYDAATDTQVVGEFTLRYNQPREFYTVVGSVAIYVSSDTPVEVTSTSGELMIGFGANDVLLEGSISQELNKSDYMELTITDKTFLSNMLEPMSSVVEVSSVNASYSDGEILFQGRAVAITDECGEDEITKKRISCEGFLGYLNDTTVGYLKKRPWFGSGHSVPYLKKGKDWHVHFIKAVRCVFLFDDRQMHTVTVDNRQYSSDGGVAVDIALGSHKISSSHDFHMIIYNETQNVFAFTDGYQYAGLHEGVHEIVTYGATVIVYSDSVMINGMHIEGVGYIPSNGDVARLDVRQGTISHYFIGVIPNPMWVYVNCLLQQHNERLGTKSHSNIELGVVDKDYPSEFVRGWNRDSVMKTIEDRLIGPLGGEIRVRVTHNRKYLDYRNSLGKHSQTEIAIGKNLLSQSIENDPSNIVSVVVPLGATIEDSFKVNDTSGNQHDVTNDSDDRRTIIGAGIPSIPTGIEVTTSGGLVSDERIIDRNALSKFGYVEKAVVFDDIEDIDLLAQYGVRWLSQNNVEQRTISISALDLSAIGVEPEAFKLGDTYAVTNQILGFTKDMRLVKISRDIDKPYMPSCEFGVVGTRA